jgi:cytoskeleton protein RodZ
LKIDARPVLDRLPQTSAPRLIRDTDGLNAPFRAPGDGPSPTWVDRVRQPVPATVIVLLLGAVIVYFLPVSHEEKVEAAPAPAPVVAQAPSPEPAPPPAPAPVSAPVADSAAPAIAAAASAPSTPPEAVAAEPAESPASGIVVFHTKGSSWVEVVDAKHAVVLSKLMAPGESAGADGALPLKVTIGKVDMTEVEVRGKKFDLRPVSRDNVAKFEVK